MFASTSIASIIHDTWDILYTTEIFRPLSNLDMNLNHVQSPGIWRQQIRPELRNKLTVVQIT
jgi:hypothetical protein